MGSGEAILWLVALTTAIMLAVSVAAALRRAAARRARQRRYRQAAHRSRMERRVTQPAALSPGISPEREAVEIEGVGIAGAKGFAGGFGRGSLGAWGEPAIKLFVKEALNEAMKLESALAKLRTPRRIALLHYSPISGTVEGEPVDIFPFLGSSRLEEPLLRYPVDAVFHGHAHRGTLEARTINGVPVYNVAKPLLLRKHPDQPPFLLFELPRPDAHRTEPTAAEAVK